MILSVMLVEEQKNRIQEKLPSGTKVLSLYHLAEPEELFHMMASALGLRGLYRD